ncbi:unnamed protein product [Bursaphelenchus xylophilus]|uniref:(pine wood nematode) hypothetical protein n=1 Tax=Bursaphelenchus xylophilus TaxID=6326 RepID=A0A1I7RYQ6_BURXY|nr:unnamed protein product [Bursaphelenchus xylophilus]CAG9092377.1 unnamed protein product [Bursaphelenchus xylophilus]
MSNFVMISLLVLSILATSLYAQSNSTITGCTGPGCLANGCSGGGCPNPSASTGNKMAFGSCSCGAMRMQDQFKKGGFGGCMAPHKSFVRRDLTTESPKAAETTQHPKGLFNAFFSKL